MTWNRDARNFVALDFVFIAFVALAVLAGCKKSNAGQVDTIVTLSADDINPDGSIDETGLKKIEAQAKAPSLMVTSGRMQVSDLALVQLAKFPNIRIVAALKSPLSDQAIAALKAAIPQVEVRR